MYWYQVTLWKQWFRAESWYVDTLPLSLRGTSSKKRAESFCQSGHSIMATPSEERARELRLNQESLKPVFPGCQSSDVLKCLQGRKGQRIYHSAGGKGYQGRLHHREKGNLARKGALATKWLKSIPLLWRSNGSKMSLWKHLHYLGGKETNQHKILDIGIVNPLSPNFPCFTICHLNQGSLCKDSLPYWRTSSFV